MDGQRFDEFVRAIATGTSRRKVIQGFGATMAAILLPSRLREAQAGGLCGIGGDECGGEEDCCAGFICGKGTCFQICPLEGEECDGKGGCCDGLICNQQNVCESDQPTPTDTGVPTETSTEIPTETSTEFPTETATAEPTETVEETEDPATEVPATDTPTEVPETQSPATEVPAATSVPVAELPNTGNGDIEGRRNWLIPAGLLGAGAALAARLGLRNVAIPRTVERSDD